MTSLHVAANPKMPGVPVAVPAELRLSVDDPPLPASWVRKVRAADERLQARMRVAVAGAVVVFAGWVAWMLVF